MSAEDWAIPQGSTVLVTGANGLLGSHIANQFLQHGFKVRGVVRNATKHSWLADRFHQNYGPDRFELWGIPDIAVEGAFDEAIKGVAAVAHTASVMGLSQDPNTVIAPSVAFAVNALKAAHATPSVRRFVFCSSSSAAVHSVAGAPGVRVTEATWNDAAVAEAWGLSPLRIVPDRAYAIYAASKVEAERAVWRYHEEHAAERPDFVVNTVLPNFVFSKPLDPAHQGFPTSSGMVALLYQGADLSMHRGIPPQYFVSAEDVGRLHVAGAVLDSVRGQRIFGFAERFNWDTLLAIFRKLEPARAFPEPFQSGEDPNEIVPAPKAEDLLRRLGRPGWDSLEESISGFVEGLRELEGDKSAVETWARLP